MFFCMHSIQAISLVLASDRLPFSTASSLCGKDLSSSRGNLSHMTTVTRLSFQCYRNLVTKA